MLSTIAVLLAAYNGIEWIDEQLQSILTQRDVDVMVFISVDKSTDGTLQWCLEKEKEDVRIKVLEPIERFGGAGKNFFRLICDVDFSKYDFVAFADQDDIWLPNKLSRACMVIANSHAQAYSSNVTAFWDDGREVLIVKSQAQTQWDFLFEAAGPGCTYVFTRALAMQFQAVLKEKWAIAQLIELHDWLFYAFARANQMAWVIDDCSNMRYRQHGNNQVGVNHGWQAKKQRLAKLASGWLFTQSVLIADFVGLGDHQFVRRWRTGGRLGFGFLATKFYSCRRKFVEKGAFLLLCLIFMVTGQNR